MEDGKDRTDTLRLPASTARLVVLGDPHGDLIALDLVLAREGKHGTAFVSVGDNVGYADAIVGAPLFTIGQPDEGWAFLFVGNGDAGKSLQPQQRRSTDSGPIAHLGASDSPNGFRLTVLGRTPFGRGRVKLEWEVKPLGTPFDGTGTQVSRSFTDTGTAGAALNELVTSLSGLNVYTWRVRLRYDPVTTPFAQHSRWLTAPWNGLREADLRMAAPTRDPRRLRIPQRRQLFNRRNGGRD